MDYFEVIWFYWRLRSSMNGIVLKTLLSLKICALTVPAENNYSHAYHYTINCEGRGWGLHFRTYLLLTLSSLKLKFIFTLDYEVLTFELLIPSESINPVFLYVVWWSKFTFLIFLEVHLIRRHNKSDRPIRDCKNNIQLFLTD